MQWAPELLKETNKKKLQTCSLSLYCVCKSRCLSCATFLLLCLHCWLLSWTNAFNGVFVCHSFRHLKNVCIFWTKQNKGYINYINGPWIFHTALYICPQPWTPSCLQHHPKSVRLLRLRVCTSKQKVKDQATATNLNLAFRNLDMSGQMWRTTFLLW